MGVLVPSGGTCLNRIAPCLVGPYISVALGELLQVLPRPPSVAWSAGMLGRGRPTFRWSALHALAVSSAFRLLPATWLLVLERSDGKGSLTVSLGISSWHGNIDETRTPLVHNIGSGTLAIRPSNYFGLTGLAVDTSSAPVL